MAGSSNKMVSSPITLPPSLKKSSSSQSSNTQKSILGFFQKKPAEVLQPNVNGVSRTNMPSHELQKKKLVSQSSKGSNHALTPAPSSDALNDEQEDSIDSMRDKSMVNGIISPITPADSIRSGQDSLDNGLLQFSSPSRKVKLVPYCRSYEPLVDIFQAKKVVNYIESADEDDEDEETFVPPTRSGRRKGRLSKRKRMKEVSEEEDYSQEGDGAADEVDEGKSQLRNVISDQSMLISPNFRRLHRP